MSLRPRTGKASPHAKSSGEEDADVFVVDWGSMTCYEASRAVSFRAKQLEADAPLLIDAPPHVTCPIALAMEEFRCGAIKAIFRRAGFGKVHFDGVRRHAREAEAATAAR